MEKKTECKIVQDLLLGYVDDVLNEESKVFVEKHLKECTSCRQRINEMKKDINENEDNNKKEIDYLKKVRTKSKIKSIGMAIGIILIFLLCIYLINFAKVNSIINKGEKSLQSNNIYIESRNIIEDNQVVIGKTYYKDGKYKSVSEIYSEDGVEVLSTIYATEGSDERYTVNKNEKIVYIEKGEGAKLQNISLKDVPFIQQRQSLIAKLGTAFVYSVETDNYQLGREYYVLKDRFEKVQRWEMWIDKETGLPLKEVNLDGSKSAFPNTDIVYEVRDNTQEHKYKFDIVTDEDVEVPEFSDYEKQYINDELIANLFRISQTEQK